MLTKKPINLFGKVKVPKYRLILFDWDGTLLRTLPLFKETMRHTMEFHGHGNHPNLDVTPFMHRSLHDIMQSLDPLQSEQMVETYCNYNVSVYESVVSEFPGVKEVIPQLYQAGLKLAVVSNNYYRTVKKGIDLLGFGKYFNLENVICSDHVRAGKPDPEMIHMALNRFQVKASESLMVGDSRNDIIAGQAALVDTAGVMWSDDVAELAACNPTYMLEHINDLLRIVL